MFKKLIPILLAIICIAFTAQAQVVIPSRGIAELSATTSITTNNTVYFDYGFSGSLGYRFPCRISLSAGLHGGTNTNTGAMYLTPFVNAKWDILDKKVTPYLNIEAGYAIQFPENRYELQPTESDQYKILDTEKYPFVEVGKTSAITSTTVTHVVNPGGVQGAKANADGRTYTPYSETYTSRFLYSQNGPYIEAGAGVGFKIGAGHMLRIGANAGFGDYFYGIWARTSNYEKYVHLETIEYQHRYEKNGQPDSDYEWKTDVNGNPIEFTVPVWVNKKTHRWNFYGKLQVSFTF